MGVIHVTNLNPPEDVESKEKFLRDLGNSHGGVVIRLFNFDTNGVHNRPDGQSCDARGVCADIRIDPNRN